MTQFFRTCRLQIIPNEFLGEINPRGPPSSGGGTEKAVKCSEFVELITIVDANGGSASTVLLPSRGGNNITAYYYCDDYHDELGSSKFQLDQIDVDKPSRAREDNLLFAIAN